MFGWWRKASHDTKVLAGIGIIAVLVAVGFGISQLPKSSSGSGGTGPTTPTRPSPPATTSTSVQPVQPAYLSTLTSSGGDSPTPGDVKLAGRDFRESIFFEKVGNTESSASFCDGSPFSCRATTYELGGKYSVFTASFGVIESGTYSPQGSWQIVIDGKVAVQNKIAANTIVPLSVSVAGGHTLELRATIEGLYEIGADSVVWGNARLSP